MAHLRWVGGLLRLDRVGAEQLGGLLGKVVGCLVAVHLVEQDLLRRVTGNPNATFEALGPLSTHCGQWGASLENAYFAPLEQRFEEAQYRPLHVPYHLSA